MGEHEVLTRINAVLQKIAREISAEVESKEPGWDQFILSVKWADAESGICDIILASAHGAGERYHSPPMGVYHGLIELGTLRRQFAHPWDELLLKVGQNGACKVEFGYPEQPS